MLIGGSFAGISFIYEMLMHFSAIWPNRLGVLVGSPPIVVRCFGMQLGSPFYVPRDPRTGFRMNKDDLLALLLIGSVATLSIAAVGTTVFVNVISWLRPKRERHTQGSKGRAD